VLARQIEPLRAAYDAHLYRPGFFVGTGDPVTSYFLDFVRRRRVLEDDKRERERKREKAMKVGAIRC